jgi:hypothetical protein
MHPRFAGILSDEDAPRYSPRMRAAYAAVTEALLPLAGLSPRAVSASLSCHPKARSEWQSEDRNFSGDLAPRDLRDSLPMTCTLHEEEVKCLAVGASAEVFASK